MKRSRPRDTRRVEMKSVGMGVHFAMAAALVIGASGALPQVSSVALGVPRAVEIALGLALLSTGLGVWIAALLQVMRAVADGALLEAGPYRLCRHPVYASWVIGVIPGAALMLDDLGKLVAAVVLYPVTALLVRDEDQVLEAHFGDVWRA